MNTEELLYNIVGLHKAFSLGGGTINVLNDLNLQLPRNKWIAVTGPSGCGKTTLLHILGGLDKPTKGQVILDGVNLEKLSASQMTKLRYEKIGFVFQSYHLFPELSALENAALPALQWKTNRKQAYQNAKNWLTQFGLENRIHHRPYELSGGEQQRVAIARSLINNPNIILADEPTGNLDAKSAQEIINILRDVRNNQKKTLIMVTHDPNIASQADLHIKLDNSMP